MCRKSKKIGQYYGRSKPTNNCLADFIYVCETAKTREEAAKILGIKAVSVYQRAYCLNRTTMADIRIPPVERKRGMGYTRNDVFTVLARVRGMSVQKLEKSLQNRCNRRPKA